jgi:FAD-dependent oxidoreductase domain-containing protein 1
MLIATSAAVKISGTFIGCPSSKALGVSAKRFGSRYHVILGGGGIMGCTSAYFLTKRFSPSEICIIERDPTYSRSSTVLSFGGIRQQFSLPANIHLSLKSINYIKDSLEHDLMTNNEVPDIQLIEGGYLVLATERGEDQLRYNHELQRKCGSVSALLDPVQLKGRFPWLNTDDIKLASLGLKNEGWFDPWLLLNTFKKKLLSLGVKFINASIIGLDTGRNQVKKAHIQLSNGEVEVLDCDYFVNTAGPHAAKLAEMAGIGSTDHADEQMRVPLPVRPRKRCVFVVHCPDGPDGDVPLIVDTSGFAFRKESQKGMYIVLLSPREEDDHEVDDLELDYQLFEETIWPLLAHRIPAFEKLKLKGGWAGFYDYNVFDQNAIIGAHPVLRNFLFANGFSGHGIQQSIAVGVAISEIIEYGESQSVDVKEFNFDRIINRKKLTEINIV